MNKIHNNFYKQIAEMWGLEGERNYFNTFQVFQETSNSTVEKFWMTGSGLPAACLWVNGSHRCGYVLIEESNLYWDRDAMNEDFNVHGGVTYDGKAYFLKLDNDFRAIGFDCAHSGDGSWKDSEDNTRRSPIRSFEYVTEECEKLARQLAQYEKPQKHISDKGSKALKDALLNSVETVDEGYLHNETVNYDGGKPPVHMVPPEFIEEMAAHFDKGGAKYDKYNWMRGMDWTRHYDSMQRHALAFLQGEDIDEETGSPHIIAVAWRAAVLYYYWKHGIGNDDRPYRE